ncbi:phytanoyl-CoA dioxygenase family protein [Cohnella silvisoli]|uniref:Phytanoyl-CoA dioxygenase family protein n=1 Tax=Cohnella silvisoli TaxID=2873699 RepID=A0ABV1L2N4_9BACL|nr:phytanoyl-CoA dioxygenase family protein [Cohnella silvisoli]MCD9021622.1 phytanoyl-CoA dioxygenase family protein [Cohnella silvisoli]
MRNIHDPKWFDDGNREQMNSILEMIADPRCVGTVEQILGGPSLFRSISYMVNPRYSSEDGNWHRDTQFMVKDDEEERAMIRKFRSAENVSGVHLQIALIDNDDIEYVPYSANRYDSPDEAYIRLDDNKSHCREDGMPNALRVALKAGDGLIFDPVGHHRGRYHKEIPRRSLHITYTSMNHVLHDEFAVQPWFDEPSYLTGLSPRAAGYYRTYADVYRRNWTSQS